MDTLSDEERAKVVVALEQQAHDLEHRLETAGGEVDAAHARWREARRIHYAVSEALNLTVSALDKIKPTTALEETL